MKDKKITKLAVIRQDGMNPCPFGLSIPSACQRAGDIIEKMAPLSIAGKDASKKEIDKIIHANNKFLTWRLMDSAEEPKKCKYASDIIQGKDTVVCNYGDSAQGFSSFPLSGAPSYSEIIEEGPNGLLAAPVNYHSDYNISRNLFYGIFSLQANTLPELIKIAKEGDTEDAAMVLFYCPIDDTVLLLQRAKHTNHAGYWGLPGGHLAKGEFPAEAIAREMYEEIGLRPKQGDIESIGYTIFDSTVDNGKCVIFVARVAEEAKERWKNEIRLNKEHETYKWFKLNEIPKKLHPVADYILEQYANISE